MQTDGNVIRNYIKNSFFLLKVGLENINKILQNEFLFEFK